MLDVKINFHNALQQEERLMAWPMVSVAQMALGFILRRVPQGRGPRGPFGAYSAKQGGTLIPASLPHPPTGLLYKTKDGRAAYKGYADWKRAVSGAVKMNFRRSGRMLRGLQIKVMSPTKVRVNFKGRNLGGKSNTAVAGFAQSHTTQSILGLSDAEVHQIARHVEATFPARYLDAQKINEMSFKARNKLAAAERSLAKAKQLFVKAHLKV